MIHFHGMNCSDCSKAGKKLKPLLSAIQTYNSTDLKLRNKKKLFHWTQIEALLNEIYFYINRVLNFLSAKTISLISAKMKIDFLNG